MYEMSVIAFIIGLSAVLIIFTLFRIVRLLRQYVAGDDLDSFDDSFMFVDGGMFNVGTNPGGILVDTMVYSVGVMIVSAIWFVFLLAFAIWLPAYYFRRKNLRMKKVISTLKGEYPTEWDQDDEFKGNWPPHNTLAGIKKMPVVRRRRVVVGRK